MLLGLLLGLLAPGTARAIDLPPGFVCEPLPLVFDFPTKLVFLPDGRMLVAEKGGIVYVVSGATRSPMWVREEEVLNADDRGLLSIAVDPDFATNRYLYFLYSCDPDSNGVELDNFDDSYSRLARYQVSATDSTTVDYSTRTVLLGVSWANGFLSGSGTHTIADLEWGRDGTLLVAAGEGAHFMDMDPGGRDPGMFGPGRADSIEDIGAFRSQFTGSLDGKILRIDPATGLGLPSNPYWNGDPASAESRVWAYGLRNPFRIARRPLTGSTDPAAGQPGTLYVGEVGWETYEEIDVVDGPGQNFGWPCFEGHFEQGEYQAATPAHCGCETLATPENPAPARTPLAVFHHGDPGQSQPAGAAAFIMIGGIFTEAGTWPREFRGRYVCADHATGWIKLLEVTPQNQLVSILDLASEADGPVSFANDPVNGDLWYVSLWTGEVRRIRYEGTVSVGGAPRTGTVSLSAGAPNPAADRVRLSLTLPAAAAVEFEVYELSGRRIWQGGRWSAGPGITTLVWPLTESSGAPARTGIYFARVRALGQEFTRRIAVVR